MDNIMISIVGLGFVGSAMMKSFVLKGYKVDEDILVYDKFKDGGIGTFESTLKSDILFMALPTMYDENKRTYDTSAIEEVSQALVQNNYKGAVVLKSTVVPETTRDLCKKFSLKYIHNPEFLTARTAFEDFHNQTHVVLGQTENCDDDTYDKVIEFYKKMYPDAEMSKCSSTESESMKLFVNCFYAVKVQMNTEFYLLCEKMGISYDKVMSMMLINGWINPMHTKIPGPDGQISYGGLCFPKDTNAANGLMDRKGTPNAVLNATITERNMMRSDADNIIVKPKKSKRSKLASIFKKN